MLTNKTIVITGGTGSFGTALVNRLRNSHLKEIRVFSRDKKKQEEMLAGLNISDRVRFFEGDIKDKESLTSAMKGADFVFHAAALKEIPYCESFPMEAVEINVTGTKNVIDSAIEAGVKKIVVVSSDKACYPLSAMGISKAMMEKVALAIARSSEEKEKADNTPSTAICVVRFGNLMGSNGTVVPLFVNQIKAGKDLTVTNPDMTRFMMTPDTAVDLALFALMHGKNGDIILKNAPSASLDTLTKALIEIYGNSNNKVKIIGPRPGEKLFETMATQEEMLKAESIGEDDDSGKYIRIPVIAGLENKSDNTAVFTPEDFNSHNANRLDIEGMKQLLSTLV
ncbi:MAG: UDP-glucose 4-epimerase [Bacteroidetes bacterium GWF2_40_14]|nr:MAG: UDP-glucose 4-epimerase [Bacteroidetes bacterium GWF2_40_14]